MILRVIFSLKCLISEQSIIRQGQHLSFLSTFSPKSCDLYGPWMQGGRKITWGKGELRRYNLSPPLLCDNNNRDVHCTQLFIISDTSLTISLIDNVHSDIARWAATQIYLFHSQNLKVLFSFMNPRTNWYFVSALGLGPIMESQRREMDKLFLFHCRLRGFYGIVHVDKEETEIVLTEARSGEEQMRWKISSVNRVFCPKTVCKRDKNKILVIITNRSVITSISFSEERCWCDCSCSSPIANS